MYRIVLAIIIMETIAQCSLQKFIQDKNSIYLLIGLICYNILALLFCSLLQLEKSMNFCNSLWNAGTGITVAIMGYLLFNQQISKLQLFGILLSIIGIYLMN